MNFYTDRQIYIVIDIDLYIIYIERQLELVKKEEKKDSKILAINCFILVLFYISESTRKLTLKSR